MDELKINYFIALCGIPGSGKTTLSHKLIDTYKAKLYSYDEIYSKSDLKNGHEVRIKILSSIAEDLRNGLNVVLDDLNIQIDLRDEVLAAIKDIECNKILVVLNTPLDKCLSRNTNRKRRLPDWVIAHTYRKYQPPSLEEGWDEILYY